MILNRNQREALNALSLDLYGVSSKWQKLLKNPKFRIVTDVSETDGIQRYVQFSRSDKDKRPGTILTEQKAREIGALTEELPKSTIAKSRGLSFEELQTALENNIEMANMAQMSQDQLSGVVATRLVSGSLNYKFSLNVANEAQGVEFEALVANLPEGIKEVVQKSVNTVDNKVEGVALDALKFVSDVIFAKNHPEQANGLVLEYFSDAFVKRKTVKRNAR